MADTLSIVRRLADESARSVCAGAAIALLQREWPMLQHYIHAAHLLSGIHVASIVWKPARSCKCMAIIWLYPPAGTLL